MVDRRKGSQRDRSGDEWDLGKEGGGFGFDYDPSVFSRGFEKLVPQRLARWALAVSVRTDKEVYEVGEPVELTITISNRLPLPVNLTIEGKRIWGWTVDGFVEAADESLHLPDTRRTLALRAGETRRFTRVWEGLIRRGGSPTRWDEPAAGQHEITAFVATEPRTEDSTTIRLR